MTIDEAGKEKRLNEGINDYLHCHRQLHYHSISGVCTTYLLVTAARCGELASTEPAAAPWDPREEVEDHERDEAEGGAAPRERRRRGDIDARRDRPPRPHVLATNRSARRHVEVQQGERNTLADTIVTSMAKATPYMMRNHVQAGASPQTTSSGSIL